MCTLDDGFKSNTFSGRLIVYEVEINLKSTWRLKQQAAKIIGQWVIIMSCAWARSFSFTFTQSSATKYIRRMVTALGKKNIRGCLFHIFFSVYFFLALMSLTKSFIFVSRRFHSFISDLYVCVCGVRTHIMNEIINNWWFCA